MTYGENTDFLNVKNFGEMYEIGLAVQDKIQKKNNGQYYTPEDVALIMSQWFDSLDGENICDVACGTGKLILTYLDFIGKEKTEKFLKRGKLYLYDFDATSLKISKTAIKIAITLFFKRLIFTPKFKNNTLLFYMFLQFATSINSTPFKITSSSVSNAFAYFTKKKIVGELLIFSNLVICWRITPILSAISC